VPNYTDAQLARLVNPTREARAYADVDAIAAFAAPWREQLVALRVYVLICLESQTGAQDDMFAAKLKSYQREFDATLTRARAASVPAPAGIPQAWPGLSAETGR
jgi:hypothetical protein